MADGALDRALPAVHKLAERKAKAFVRRCGWAAHEWEDVQSQLVMAFMTRWPKYDATRASVQTFASRLMDKELIAILRYRLALSRQPGEIPTLECAPNAAVLHQFRLDLNRAMVMLPPVVRQTAHALSWHSATDAAKALGCSRQMINRRKRQIRGALLAAGLRPDYFAGRGARL